MSLKQTKLFIIDDSALIRYGLNKLISENDKFVVVGSSASSINIDFDVRSAKADIVIADLPTPREKAFSMLKKIAKLRIPIIVFTKSDDKIAKDLIPLLEVGVVGFILKPEPNQDILEIRDQLYNEIELNTPKSKSSKLIKSKTGKITFLDPLKVIMIGSSTGGPEALAKVVTQIPANIRHGVVFVQHMPADFMTRFAKRLNKLSPIPIKEAENGDVIEPGKGLIAPGGVHMTFKEVIKGNKRLSKVVLTDDPPLWNLRPTVDKMMTTLAPIYKANSVGIILTGMGEDGVIGMREIKNQGGQTIVQNKETSVVFGMGQQVIKNNLADYVLPLDKIFAKAMDLLK